MRASSAHEDDRRALEPERPAAQDEVPREEDVRGNDEEEVLGQDRDRAVGAAGVGGQDGDARHGDVHEQCVDGPAPAAGERVDHPALSMRSACAPAGSDDAVRLRTSSTSRTDEAERGRDRERKRDTARVPERREDPERREEEDPGGHLGDSAESGPPQALRTVRQHAPSAQEERADQQDPRQRDGAGEARPRRKRGRARRR